MKLTQKIQKKYGIPKIGTAIINTINSLVKTAQPFTPGTFSAQVQISIKEGFIFISGDSPRGGGLSKKASGAYGRATNLKGVFSQVRDVVSKITIILSAWFIEKTLDETFSSPC
ncbi:hypothetical protein [uncultured Desulfuromonas sp.]|uniref:hypothetical protein n=1 Tax=uncultured Desulfuromonas sp. TaxID=181013 RepID=UPI002AAA68A5|nr:hypothetical protein [uncultured Desulfuromonas sp.]